MSTRFGGRVVASVLSLLFCSHRCLWDSLEILWDFILLGFVWIPACLKLSVVNIWAEPWGLNVHLVSRTYVWARHTCIHTCIATGAIQLVDVCSEPKQILHVYSNEADWQNHYCIGRYWANAHCLGSMFFKCAPINEVCEKHFLWQFSAIRTYMSVFVHPLLCTCTEECLLIRGLIRI